MADKIEVESENMEMEERIDVEPTNDDEEDCGQTNEESEKAETFCDTNTHVHINDSTSTLTINSNNTHLNAESDSVFTSDASFTVPKYLSKLAERKNKRKLNSPGGQENRNVRARVGFADTEEMLLTVYISGVDYDLSEEVKHSPIKYKAELEYCYGSYFSARLTKQSLRVVCRNADQKSKYMSISTLQGKQVVVSEPFCLSKTKSKTRSVAESVGSTTAVNTGQNIVRGIIFGVSVDVSDDEICEETECLKARRLTHFEDGVVVRTTTVVLSFEDKLPDVVYIGLLTFRVRIYIPPPVRCKNCQSFSHRSENCHARVRCSRCAGHHTFDKCQATADSEGKKCANCNGDHSAAYRGCPKYVEVKEALTLAVKGKKTYKEALLEVKLAHIVEDALSNDADPSVHEKPPAQSGNGTAVLQKKSETQPVKATVSVASQTDPELSTPFFNHVLHSLASCCYVLLSNLETPMLDKKTVQEKQLQILNIVEELKSHDSFQLEAIKTPVDKLHPGNWGSPGTSKITVTALVHANPENKN